MNTAQKPLAVSQPQSITILGSTGTIGQNTLKLIKTHPDKFNVHALVANNNAAMLAKQAIDCGARQAIIANEKHYDELKKLLSGTNIKAAAGNGAIIEAASGQTDIIMSAIVGAAGLAPTLAAIKNGATIALANKECLVCAGELMMTEVAKYNTTLIPVDSEHNAIFQVLDENQIEWVNKITITASGGPFRTWSFEQMKEATPEQAVKHPNWNMGAKISVDSATMMNKGLELIEAYYLFPLKANQLEVIVHPQSIIHCLVRMVDGSVLAQMSNPDMCTPIANAMAWPQRISAPVKPLDLTSIKTLDFEAPDTKRFPALRIAKEVLKAGGNASTIMNAANEIAVERFLQKQIKFTDIAKIVEKTLESIENTRLTTIDDVLAYDDQARQISEKI